MNLHLLLPAIPIPTKLIEVLFGRIRVPAVVGAIVAGVLLGPALLGIVPTEEGDPAGYRLMHELAQIGLCVLLFKIGLETRFADFLPVWRTATGIALAGMGLPLALGLVTAWGWGWSLQGAVFLGATLTATSIGVTASVLSELNAQKSREGILIMGAAVLDDVLGLLLLSALVAYINPGLSVGGQVLVAFVQAIAFIAAGIFVGPYIVKGLLRISGWAHSRGFLLILAFAYFLLLAYIAKLIGLDMIIGAYAAGVAFARYPERHQIEQDFESLTEILTPLFFVMLGAAVEFSGFNPMSEAGRQAWVFTLVLIGIAVLGKLLCAGWIRDGEINIWAIGNGMMPRGEVGFVFAQIGMTAGIFSAAQFSVIVVVLVATTLAGPVLLRWSWKPE